MKDLFIELETDRLILRKINVSDAKVLYESIYSDFDWYKYYYSLPFENFEEYLLLVEKYDEWYQNGNHYRWGIVKKDTNEIIGLVQLHTKDTLNNNCKIGYIISKYEQKKGYAREAVAAILNFGFNNLGYYRIEADIVVQNVNSIKLAENLGMQYEGLRKGSYKLNEQYLDQKVYVLFKEQ